uniref:DUF4783 domain-containing protein n=1 Tax=Caenorhabditis tropicalis TaxID=1561998 RepID=A0A1I7TTW7_9PELO
MRPLLLLFLCFLTIHAYVPSNPAYSGKQNTAQIGEYLIKLLIEGIESRNTESISGLLAEKFYFVDCKGTFHREQFIILLTSLPPKSKLTYKLKFSEKKRDFITIESTIVLMSADGSKKNFETVFYFDIEKSRFENGGITNCKE